MPPVPTPQPAGTAAPPAPQTAAGASAAPARPALDLSALEPPRALEELRLEDVTIDGICGVY